MPLRSDRGPPTSHPHSPCCIFCLPPLPIFINPRFVVSYKHSMRTQRGILSVSIKATTLTVAFVTLECFALHSKALFLHSLTLPVWLCACFNVLSSFALPPSSPPPTGRVSLTRGASLLVEKLTLEDEGWFECRILLLDSEKDDFRNGTWTFLSITGAALRGFGNSRGASFIAHHWHDPCLEQPQHGAWLRLLANSSVMSVTVSVSGHSV